MILMLALLIGVIIIMVKHDSYLPDYSDHYNACTTDESVFTNEYITCNDNSACNNEWCDSNTCCGLCGWTYLL